MNGMGYSPMRRKNVKRLIRKGRRIYGAIYELKDGREVYLAWRKQSEMYRGGEKSNSEAISTGKASWALDYDTVLTLGIEGVTLAGVLVKETEDIYIASLADFKDSTKSKTMSFEGRGGALQHYLPLKYFGVMLGSVRIK